MKYCFQILLLILIGSCSKKEYHTPLNIEFKSSNGIEIFTLNDNSFRVPPNCFEDEKGKEYKGKVKFELIEVLTKEDMLKYDLTTTSNGNMLVSGGMFYLSAKTENGENLRIKETESIGLCAKLGIDKNRYLRFYGTRDGARFDWVQENERESSNFSSNGDFFHGPNCIGDFIFNINKLGWINCDYFVNENLDGNLALTSSEPNIKVRLVFKDLNSIMEFERAGNNFQLGRLPLNRKAKVIAYKESNSKIDFYEKEITIDSMQTFEITLEEISLTEFKEKVKNM